MKKLTKFGFWITAVWLLVFVAMVFYNLDSSIAMNLNELGDFLAGVSAPLALLWLVIGYFQHGEELRLNTKALRAQQQELQRQVEQTAVLANNAARQAAATEELARLDEEREVREKLLRERDAQPEFIDVGGGSSREEIHRKIKNRGADATIIELNCTGAYFLNIAPAERLETGSTAKLTLSRKNWPLEFPIRFSISYTDKFGKRQTKECELQKDHKFREMLGGGMEEKQ